MSGMTRKMHAKTRSEWAKIREVARSWCGPVGWGATLIAIASVPAGAQEPRSLLERPARLDVSGVQVEEALRSLQRTSGVALAFSPDLLPTERPVACRCMSVTVSAALERILEGTDLVFESGARQVLIGRRKHEETPTILEGIIVEAGSGRPIPSAEIRTVDRTLGATAGDDGRFRLRGVDAGPAVLRVGSLGYEERTLEIAPGASVRIELERRPIPLEEMVISPGRFGVLDVDPAVLSSTVSREDIEAIPQFGDDVFRTLKRMPGVFAEDISTKLNVRGGTDRDLLVHLDGLELFEPYHLKDLDGALGIVDVQSLGGIDLVTGGFPAEYGDKTAGVFNMYSRTPPATGTRTTLGMSLSSLSAISQGSFAERRGQWLVSLRRGFLEYALSVAGVEDDLDPRYWDALGRVQYLLSDDHLVWLELLHAGDDLDWYDDETQSSVTSTWSNSYAWTGWKGSLGSRLRTEVIASVGRLTRDRVGDVENPNGGAFTPLTADIRDVATFDFAGLKQDWQLDITDDLMLKLGGELRTTRGEYDYLSAATRYDLTPASQLFLRTDSNSVRLRPTAGETGAHASLRGRVGPRFTWEAGARHDWREHTGDSDIAPRLLVRLDLFDRTSVKASLGRYFQSHGLHELSARDGEDTYAPSEMAEQLAVGIERTFAGGLSVRLEGYHRTIENPRPIFVNLSREVNPIEEVEADRRRLDPTEARAKGIELIVARDGTGPASWSASYALSSAEDRIDGSWAPRTLDQRHTVNLRGAYRIGRSWQLSGAWSYHTGWPFTRQFLDVEVGLSEDGSETIDVIRRGFGPYNAERLPAYHRLDLRLTRTFELERSRLEVFLDVFNAYNRTNLRGFDWTLRQVGDRFTTRRSPGEEQLPILPTIGFRWVF